MKVVDIAPSANWSSAIVVRTDCGHANVRPSSWPVSVGDEWECYCAEDRTMSDRMMSARKALAVGVLVEVALDRLHDDMSVLTGWAAERRLFVALEAIVELLKR